MVASKRKLEIAFRELPEDEENAVATWRDAQFSDWVLVLGEKRYPIHKIILGKGERRSLFLMAAFRQHFREVEETDLSEVLPESCWSCFEEVLDYWYAARLEFTTDNWPSVMKTADVLQVPSLHKLCLEQFASLIHISSALLLVSQCQAVQLSEDACRQVMQLAVDECAPRFTTGRCKSGKSPKSELAAMVCQCGSSDAKSSEAWLTQILLEVLKHDMLEMTEDDVFDFVEDISNKLACGNGRLLWELVRLRDISDDRLLRAVELNCYRPKELVWASLCKHGSRLPTPQGIVQVTPRQGNRITGVNGVITFIVTDPLSFEPGESCRSIWYYWAATGLPGFECSLLVFPKGTTCTGEPHQLAAFVAVRPCGAEIGASCDWKLQGVDLRIEVQKTSGVSFGPDNLIHCFSNSSDDRGYHRGFLRCSDMTEENEWLNKHKELTICAHLSLI